MINNALRCSFSIYSVGWDYHTELSVIALRRVVGTSFDTDDKKLLQYDKKLLQYLFTIVPMKIVAPC